MALEQELKQLRALAELCKRDYSARTRRVAGEVTNEGLGTPRACQAPLAEIARVLDLGEDQWDRIQD